MSFGSGDACQQSAVNYKGTISQSIKVVGGVTYICHSSIGLPSPNPQNPDSFLYHDPLLL